jgi:purine nucleosidase
MPLVIDTDIGTDPDDLQVLMLAGHRGLDVVGITTVYGDTDLRARMASVVAACVGLDCPVVAGEAATLSGREVMWAGHEGQGVPGIDHATYDEGRRAPTFLSELANRYAGELDVLAIGPLTNVAVAFLTDPQLPARVRHLYIMGGRFDARAGGPEHNASADALATWIVLHRGVPATVSGFEMTTRVVFNSDDLDVLTNAGEAGAMLAANLDGFHNWLRDLGLAQAGRGSIPHDPIALLTRQQPELFEMQPCRLEVIGWGPDAGQTAAVPDAAGRTRVVRAFDPDQVRHTLVDAIAM